jgi:hypothetical protein
LPPLAALCHRQLLEFVTIFRDTRWGFTHFNFHLLATRFFVDDLVFPLMTKPTQRKRGGRAYHSVLEPHFDFIHQQRQRRKTWQEIADLLLTEKSIRVTLYAPYHFYRRKLKRAAKPHWENSTVESQPAHPSATANRPQSRPAPLPIKPDFKRPNLSNINTEAFP